MSLPYRMEMVLVLPVPNWDRLVVGEVIGHLTGEFQEAVAFPLEIETFEYGVMGFRREEVKPASLPTLGDVL